MTDETFDPFPEKDNVITHPAVAALPESWRAPEEEGARDARGDIRTLIEALVDVRTQREGAKARLEALQSAEDVVERQLFDAMERQNLRAVRHERGLFLLNDLAWAKIIDRGAAIQWAEDKNPELLTLNNSSLSKLVRDALKGEEGAEIPPGVEFTVSRKVTWRTRT